MPFLSSEGACDLFGAVHIVLQKTIFHVTEKEKAGEDSSASALRKTRLPISPVTEVSPPPADEAARERAKQWSLGNLQRGHPASRGRRALLAALDEAVGDNSACASVPAGYYSDEEAVKGQ